jgi:hypothetical protein
MQQLIEAVDELTYRNYKFNRDISPDVSADRWKKIYGAQSGPMEARYLRENELLGPGVSFKDLDRWILRSE